MLRQDEDGRWPLSVPEFETLRYLYGVVDAFTRGDILEERLKLIPGGWRDFRMLEAKMDALFAKILTTVPISKLQMIKAEVRNTETRVTTKRNAADSKDLSVVDTDRLWALMDRCVKMDCTFCGKSACEGRKCDIYRTITNCLPYEFRGNGKSCPLAGSSELTMGNGTIENEGAMAI